MVIATPAGQHLDDLARVVSLGRHVFVEKPICLIGEAEKTRMVLQYAHEKSLIVVVGYNLRFHPRVMAVKNQIAVGAFKPMWGSFLLRQKPTRPLAHFLEEWASHEIDLAMHLLGVPCENKVWPHAFERWVGNKACFALRHADERKSFICADALTPEPFRRAFTIVGQDGASITCDIEADHVQPEHYRAELEAWIHEIESHQLCKECAVVAAEPTPLATGWDGLAAIELLERLTK
jgi:predicted dehydrogenase